MNSMSLHSSFYMFGATEVALSSTALLVWDHLVTLDLEVEHIWKAKKSLLTILFFINRYVTLIGKLLTFALLCPLWTDQTCQIFVKYEVSITLFGISLVAFMMFLRVKALYHKHPVVIWTVAALGVLKFAMNLYILVAGDAALMTDSLECMIVLNVPKQIYIMGWSFGWLPLINDTAILVLTVYKLLPPLKNQQASYVVKQLFQDGILYYFVIFAITAVTNMLINLLMDGPRNVAAQQFGLVLTVSMMSRISLNLKESAHNAKNTVMPPAMPVIHSQSTDTEGSPDSVIIIPSGNYQAEKLDSRYLAVGDDSRTTAQKGDSMR